jgi:hypothetical protein
MKRVGDIHPPPQPARAANTRALCRSGVAQARAGEVLLGRGMRGYFTRADT